MLRFLWISNYNFYYKREISDVEIGHVKLVIAMYVINYDTFDLVMRY